MKRLEAILLGPGSTLNSNGEVGLSISALRISKHGKRMAMLTRREYEQARQDAVEMIVRSGIQITDDEKHQLSVVDFGLSRLPIEGAQILTIVDTKRVALKIIALFPKQTEPEHWHPKVGEDPGKEETLRLIKGTLYFYGPGEDSLRCGFIPKEKEAHYTVRKEIIMKPGDQITLDPGTKHWFQAGEEGAVMYTISTTARDILDRFTDPSIVRETKVVDD